MNIPVIIHGIGSIPLFSSRAFLPAFITAFILRFGDNIPFIASSDIVKLAGDQPSWFTSNGIIFGLGFLTVLEIIGDKNADIRHLISEVIVYTKPAVAALTYLGIISAADADYVTNAIQQAGLFDVLPAIAVGLGVYVLNSWQNLTFFNLLHGDEDDDLGIQSVMSWGKDIFASFGMILIILFPVVMVILCAIISGIFALLARIAQAQEEKSKIQCSNCDSLIYASACFCPDCQTKNQQPLQIGMLGQTIDDPVSDLKNHQLHLVEMKRCPTCATRLSSKDIDQSCELCDSPIIGDKTFATAYLNRVQARLPSTLVITFVMSLIPIIGLIPGVIYYRYKLAGPFRRYLPVHKNIMNKILIQLFMIILISCQLVPGIGGFSVPIMALTTFLMYKRTFLNATNHFKD